jgi:hypothetical protein
MAKPTATPFTPDEVKQIEAMAGLGMSGQDIAHVMGIHRATLYKRLKDTGLSSDTIKAQRKKGVAKVRQTLYQMATSGKVPAATFFYLKTIGGLREKDRMELTGKDGGAIQNKLEVVITNLSKK